jgi:hypothetical protein
MAIRLLQDTVSTWQDWMAELAVVVELGKTELNLDTWHNIHGHFQEQIVQY